MAAYHSEERERVECLICQKKFVNKSVLTNHHLTVHKQPSFAERTAIEVTDSKKNRTKAMNMTTSFTKCLYWIS